MRWLFAKLRWMWSEIENRPGAFPEEWLAAIHPNLAARSHLRPEVASLEQWMDINA